MFHDVSNFLSKNKILKKSIKNYIPFTFCEGYTIKNSAAPSHLASSMCVYVP